MKAGFLWSILVLSFAACRSLLAAEPEWGTIKGQVIVTGQPPVLPVLVKKDDTSAKDSAVCAGADIPDESLKVDSKTNGLANVVIWLIQKPVTIHSDLVKSKNAEVKFHQKGCRFVPHILLVRTDQKVRVLTDDAVAHILHDYALKNSSVGHIVQPSSRDGYLYTGLTQPERLPVPIGCDVHPWMRAFWVILDHPYVAVTNERGEFEIDNLPAGVHEFRIWQERAGYLEMSYKVMVKAGENKLIPIQFPADKFKK